MYDIVWYIVFMAVGLLLVLEGVVPFLSPKGWRKMADYLSKKSDKALRIFGLVFMLLGVLIIHLIHRNLLF